MVESKSRHALGFFLSHSPAEWNRLCRVLGTTVIWAHRTYLTSRSQVFAASLLPSTHLSHRCPFQTTSTLQSALFAVTAFQSPNPSRKSTARLWTGASLQPPCQDSSHRPAFHVHTVPSPRAAARPRSFSLQRPYSFRCLNTQLINVRLQGSL